MSRSITYCEAINEAMHQEMQRDKNIFVYGIGVSDHTNIFGSIKGIKDTFGSSRCFDTPLSEDAMTGFGAGAAINGCIPIHIHIRIDFLVLAMNQLSNILSNIRYLSGGKLKVPIVIRAMVGRGWGQGSQHSKTMQSVFAHIPGLKVVMPTSPMDAKGLLTSAIRDGNPVLVLEHRWLYWQLGEVPEESFTIPIGLPNLVRKGKDLTIVATSWMVVEAMLAADILHRKKGLEIEVVDPRTVTPFDYDILVDSVKKTRKCIVADNDWVYCGFGAEIAATLSEKCFNDLDMPIARIGFAHVPCPTARHLENEFYPNAKVIVRKIEDMMHLEPTDLSDEEFFSHEKKFIGPF